MNGTSIRQKSSSSYKRKRKKLSISSVSQNSKFQQKVKSSPSTSKNNTKCANIMNAKLPELKSRPLTAKLTEVPSRITPSPKNLLPPPFERRKKVALLTAIKPENEKSEKERFMRAHFVYNPLFIYKYPADSSVIEKFNKPSARYLTQAILIMEKALARYGSYEIFEEITGGPILNRPYIYTLVRKYLKKENLENDININLSEDLLSRGSMTQVKGRPTVNVRIVNLREQWAEGLLRHEIGTHYIRSCNNQYQLWANFRTRRELGLLPLNPTEEGLASLHSVLTRTDPLLWRAALLYYTAYKASVLSFKELFHDLEQFVHSPNVRWDYCIRAKRGQTDTSKPGSFCKDQVYLDGALQILKRRHTLDFSLLVRLGKVSHRDIELLEDICELENTKIPSFMNDMNLYKRQIDRIADVNGLTDNILAEVE
ncbi:putative tyrosine carboxypeptidase MATCAP2 [Patella vulgata]|uniref:putative tyrosine carboxypeptidase MATCAP2 n=1 Tax=Patella vulgata TaxID=6465 RepID=UPI0021801A0C|nr:putative tyrosine carboxypeptidase MATCAP2 [Patella vulgata]